MLHAGYSLFTRRGRPRAGSIADLLVIGDARVLATGARVAGVEPDVEMRQGLQDCQVGARPVFIDLGHLDPARIESGVATRAGGEFALANFRAALRLARPATLTPSASRRSTGRR